MDNRGDAIETNLKEELDAEIMKFEKKLSPKNLKMLKSTFQNLVHEDASVREAMGIQPDDEEALYAFAHQLFQSGKYKQAWGTFWFLRSLEPLSYRYNFAIAACYQYMEQYSEAAFTYLLAAVADDKTPIPFFHLYECYLKINQPECALVAIKMAIDLAEKEPEFSPLLERAQLEYKQLRKELKHVPNE